MNDQQEQIRVRTRQFIFDTFPLARKKELNDNDSLVEGGVIDSMGVLDIVAFLEEELKVTPTDDEMTAENFESIEVIADFAYSKLSNGPEV